MPKWFRGCAWRSSAIGAEAEMHLDLRGRWFARNAPRRIAGGGIRVEGKIDWPRLRRNAWQREADGPVACLVHQRGGGNDRCTVAIMSAPLHRQKGRRISPRFPDFDLHVLLVVRQGHA